MNSKWHVHRTLGFPSTVSRNDLIPEAGTGIRDPPTVIRGWVAQKSAVGPQSVKSALMFSVSEKYNGIKWQCSYSHYISQVVPEPPGNQ